MTTDVLASLTAVARKAKLNAWPFFMFGACRNRLEIDMTEQSKKRIAADSNFLKIQTQSLARNRILSESDSAAHQRDTNMAKQRQQRLEKEAADKQVAMAIGASKKRKR